MAAAAASVSETFQEAQASEALKRRDGRRSSIFSLCHSALAAL